MRRSSAGQGVVWVQEFSWLGVVRSSQARHGKVRSGLDARVSGVWRGQVRQGSARSGLDARVFEVR